MKEFNDFLAYYQDHISEVAYDASRPLWGIADDAPAFIVNSAEIISQIAQESCLAVLRQYHEWLEQQQ